MTATPYAFYPYPTGAALSSLLPLYLLLYEYLWLAMMSECQTAIMKKQ